MNVFVRRGNLGSRNYGNGNGDLDDGFCKGLG